MIIKYVVKDGKIDSKDLLGNVNDMFIFRYIEENYKVHGYLPGLSFIDPVKDKILKVKMCILYQDSYIIFVDSKIEEFFNEGDLMQVVQESTEEDLTLLSSSDTIKLHTRDGRNNNER